MNLHDPATFPKELFGLSNKKEDMTFISPDKVKEQFVLPEIGCLYELTNSETWDHVTVNTYLDETTGELVEYSQINQVKIPPNRAVLCLDFIIYELSRGIQVNDKLAIEKSNTNLVHCVLCRALFDTRIVHRGFLITPNFNQFVEYLIPRKNNQQ